MVRARDTESDGAHAFDLSLIQATKRHGLKEIRVVFASAFATEKIYTRSDPAT